MIVIVGGHSRKAGKTSLIEWLIRSIPEAHWTAIKVTPHPHASLEVHEERDPAAPGDTARYLAAGARRAFLVTVAPESWSEAAGTVRQLIAGGNAIVESNSLSQHLEAGLCLMVLGSGAPKPSARALLERADAFITAEPGGERVAEGKPRFEIGPALLEFVRERLRRNASQL